MPVTGDEIAGLYGQHYQDLVRLSYFLVRDAATAEDVVQDAFAALARRRQRPRNGEAVLDILRQAVLSRSRDAVRRSGDALPGTGGALPGTGGGCAALEQDAVVSTLLGLPYRQREAIVLRYYSGLPEAKIAATMGISLDAVRSHTARGIAVLHAAMRPD
jgi:DNA-directed RNA polymerase specialized sigma24 family protein